MNSPHDPQPWAEALRASPIEAPALSGRVTARVRQARAIRRGSLAAVVLAALGGAWLAIDARQRPHLAAPTNPQPGPSTLAHVEPSPQAAPVLRGESLAVPSPVARLEILADQQAAVLDSLEQWTKEL